MNVIKRYIYNVCKEGVGAGLFFPSIFVWGVGVGCFAATLNNFMVEIHRVSGTGRGILEFFRETPGVLLIFILAMLHKLSNWNVLRLGAAFSLLAAGLLLIPTKFMGAVIFVTIFSLGEHIVMPVRQVIAISIARPGKEGESQGMVTSAISAGTVVGSLIVACVFYALPQYFGVKEEELRIMFNTVWCIIIGLLIVSVCLTLMGKVDDIKGKRPNLYFNKKYWRFYTLELFYGARKQVFLTFGPLLLIKGYDMDTKQIATLFGISALITALFGGRLIGKIVDYFGYRNVMIYDTVILGIVCLMYGFADKIFPLHIAIWVVCINYILDMLISHAAMAAYVYAASLSDSKEELTATLSSGISINHVISVLVALAGGVAYDKFGPGALFSFAAVMAVANTLFATTIPRIKAK